MNITKRINVRIRLLSPLVHNGQAGGSNITSFRRMDFMTPQGELMKVPVYSGNAIRGVLRDLAFVYLASVLGLSEKLHPLQFHLLTGGGSLTKDGNPKDIEELRGLRSLLPSFSLWGGSVGNVIYPGKWDSGLMMPIVRETTSFVPPSMTLDSREITSVYDIMSNNFYTRHDDSDGNRNSDMLYVPVDGGKAGDPQQMIYEIESMNPGTNLYWWLGFTNITPLEELAFVSALTVFAQRPVLGGMGRIGHGLVQMDFANGWFISPSEANLPDLGEYDDHLLSNKDAIMKVLYG